MKSMPCVDCITLSMCKAQIDRHDYHKSVMMIQKKCALTRNYNRSIKGYTERKEDSSGSYYRLKGLHQIFIFLTEGVINELSS